VPKKEKKDPVVISVNVPQSVAVTMKEDVSAYRTDRASGETDNDFEGWIKQTRPGRWETYLKATGRGK